MSARAKFHCFDKDRDPTDPSRGSVCLEVVYTGSADNDRFFNLRPTGSILIATLNPEAFDLFEQGKDYYVDFTPAE